MDLLSLFGKEVRDIGKSKLLQNSAMLSYIEQKTFAEVKLEAINIRLECKLAPLTITKLRRQDQSFYSRHIFVDARKPSHEN